MFIDSSGKFLQDLSNLVQNQRSVGTREHKTQQNQVTHIFQENNAFGDESPIIVSDIQLTSFWRDQFANTYFIFESLNNFNTPKNSTHTKQTLKVII